MILDKIVADNLTDLELRKRRLPLPELQRLVAQQSEPPLDLAASLAGEGVRLIAEVKQASPSRGIIRPDFDPVAIAADYSRGGAAAISVLTESRYFLGSLDYLKQIQDSLGEKRLPLLRKDFIHDVYQVYESRYFGADSLLLIVAILNENKLKELLELSHRLGMKCLVEVHAEAELDLAVKSGARIIGINNRDLKTFKVDLAVTEQLSPLVPPGTVMVSESGIHDNTDIARLQRCGVNAFLVGEALMTAADIPAKIRELLWSK
jgi:indole-3-glycerol phosphate synthase